MIRKLKLSIMMFMILFSNHLLFCSLTTCLLLFAEQRDVVVLQPVILWNVIWFIMLLSCTEQVENTHEPATYSEAIGSGDHEKWISAMQEEMQSLEKNGT